MNRWAAENTTLRDATSRVDASLSRQHAVWKAALTGTSTSRVAPDLRRRVVDRRALPQSQE
jgi:hypothetical protein